MLAILFLENELQSNGRVAYTKDDKDIARFSRIDWFLPCLYRTMLESAHLSLPCYGRMLFNQLQRLQEF
jgi:hypothetical protein